MAEEISQEKLTSIAHLLDSLNERLSGLMPYKLALVDPKALILAGKNARFMKPEIFKSLISNIKQDKNLSSVPFCYRNPDGRFHVLSGNHRVQAAVHAGVELILIFYNENLSRDQQTGIQLSHNALEGSDDLKILKELWESIQDIEFKVYSGLDSETLKELGKIDFQGFSEERLEYKSVSFLFLPEEIERAEEVFDRIHVLYSKEDVYIFSLRQWEKFFSAISRIKTSCNIKNSAAAFSFLLDLAEEKISGLSAPAQDTPSAAPAPEAASNPEPAPAPETASTPATASNSNSAQNPEAASNPEPAPAPEAAPDP